MLYIVYVLVQMYMSLHSGASFIYVYDLANPLLVADNVIFQHFLPACNAKG